MPVVPYGGAPPALPPSPPPDWPWQACPSALSVDGVALDSIAYGVAGLEAPESLPPRRGENYVIGDRPGRRWTPKVVDQRVITLSMWARGLPDASPVPWGDTTEQFRANYRALRALFARTERLLELTRTIALPDGVLTLTAQAEVGGTMDLAPQGVAIGFFSVDLVMPDPYWYGPEVSASTALPAGGGGLSFPVSFPVSFGGGGGGGQIAALNPGDANASPTIRFDGPLTDPYVTHAETGRTIALTMELAGGDWVLVDFAERTVLLNGTASRYGSLTTAQWFELTPGPNTLLLRGFAGTGSATATFRPPYN